ncbi:MAG: hypothetical protein M0006_03310 [Magnetospirillum sp.]|nr:hypothetical protein [Magnetospirillum sp.]
MKGAPETGTVILGGHSHAVSPLPFGRLRVIGERWDDVWMGNITAPRNFDAAVAVYAAALGKTEEEILQIPATFAEILAGLTVIGRVSGLLVQKEDAGPLDGTATGTTGG